MSTIDLGHGFLVHLPESRPTDPNHARAWDMLNMDRARLKAAIAGCRESAVIRIVARMKVDDEAIYQACQTRALQLAGVVEEQQQLHLFGDLQ